MDLDFKIIDDFKPAQIKTFKSGVSELDNYFTRYAKKNSKSGLSPCTIMIPKGEMEPILGYATVSNATVEKGDNPPPVLKKLPNYPISVTLIGRLAISKEYQGKGLGRHFLMHIFYNAHYALKSLNIGTVGIITDAKNQDAVNFYSKYDLKLLPGQNKFPKRMFISMDDIACSLP